VTTVVSVLIPYREQGGWRDRHLNTVMDHWRSALGDTGEVILGSCSADSPFNRSEACNDAFDGSIGSLIAIADADTLFDPNAITLATAAVTNGAPWVVPHDMYYNATREWTQDFYACDQKNREQKLRSIVHPLHHEHALKNTISGMLVMSRDAFVTAGGMDQRFIGWGYEDDAFGYALWTLVGKPVRVLESFVVHLWHPRSDAENFKQPHILENKALMLRYRSANMNPESMRELIGGNR